MRRTKIGELLTGDLNKYSIKRQPNQALGRTVMEELARGFDDNAIDPDGEEGTLSQTVIDDMEDMFA